MKLAGLLVVGLASGCLGDTMTGPRRIQRQGRSQDNLPMDWEFGGWKPLETPKGFYRRISRNLLKDEEGRLLNEVGVDTGDLDASASNKIGHTQALEDFLKSSPGCNDCGFQPLIFLNRAQRKVRAAVPWTETQQVDSHQDRIIEINDRLKERHRQNVVKRGRREIVNQLKEETKTHEINDGLDQAKVDKIRTDSEEPHFLSPAAVIGIVQKLAAAIAAEKKTESQPEKSIAAPIVQSQPSPTNDKPSKEESLEEPHFLSPKAAHLVEKSILEALVKKPESVTGDNKDAGQKSTKKSRVKRQLWNPFRRRPVASKPSSGSGGPFGFVNHNVPFDAQESINSFSYAQSIPQSSFQANDFQSFVPPPPPITNFDKVQGIPNNHFQKPSQSEFPQYSSVEPEIIPPVPTRPVKRPEPVQSDSSDIPSPHIIDSIIGQFQATGQLPPDLSPETALLIADILSGKRQNVPVEPVPSVAPAIDIPAPYVEPVKPILSHREPAPLPDFHTKPLTSSPVSFGSLPPPPPKAPFHGITRNKPSIPIHSHHDGISTHSHDGVHLNSDGFQRPHTVTTVRTRKRKKPTPPSIPKVTLAEKVAEHTVEKDHHSAIFPEEHVHIHHHHQKKKKKRPTVLPQIHSPSHSDDVIVPSIHTVSDVHSHHGASPYDQSPSVHIETKQTSGAAPPVSEAELGSDTRSHPVTVDPLQTLDEIPSDKPDIGNSEYYDDIFKKATQPPSNTQEPQWPVDDPYLTAASTTTEGPQTVGPKDILIQDAKPGIPLLASDLNSLKIKTKSNSPTEASNLPQPVFRPESHTKKDTDQSAKQANQDEDDISAGAGAIHFQPIQTKDGENNSATGNAQLYHAYYAPAHHDPPTGYIRMTVDEFNKLFKDAEIQFIGSEQELQKKLGTKPTNKLNFDITKEGKGGEEENKPEENPKDEEKKKNE